MMERTGQRLSGRTIPEALLHGKRGGRKGKGDKCPHKQITNGTTFGCRSKCLHMTVPDSQGWQEKHSNTEIWEKNKPKSQQTSCSLLSGSLGMRITPHGRRRGAFAL
ncbi:hypothetical protein, unlikely [Trypanosoma brucei gambiense DAL972]|uniref:Uncharacterized protein n=1 Tax=Trypanosoma brucei gambiense (strain MHOM/CI/86/DAL972) TaxID=679716 RepID=D0A0E0_TRYB9|nr:hypothetical protein, unlikely [Trypanosoma brucei gambiense DAL972]CBH16698.1 hypothetical protein, unlikely [Trypanosoma brucei gambiense DAL972]|eukprot:XP_011778962.1 hypothetical protein, unlikely [Trypanosoma brucei gambiense DAL972]